MRVLLVYFFSMNRWLCTVMLVVFTLTMGLSGGGTPSSLATHPATVGAIVSGPDIARVQSRCCMDKQIADRSGTTRCLSDCSFSIASVAPLVIPVTKSRADGTAGAAQSRYAAAVFRPPIT